jgi:TRAP-type C4-dicarboxylate transport system substrate-binding protein
MTMRSGLTAALLLATVAACSDSHAADSCVSKAEQASVRVCWSHDGGIHAEGLQPGSALTISDSNGDLPLVVGPDGKLVGASAVVQEGPTGNESTKISFEATASDGSTFSGELTFPG